jgi:hypothetical protein
MGFCSLAHGTVTTAGNAMSQGCHYEVVKTASPYKNSQVTIDRYSGGKRSARKARKTRKARKASKSTRRH